MPYYKLGGSTTVFWDPTQPDQDNHKLLPGEIKDLAETTQTAKYKRNGGLEVASKMEFEEYKTKKEELKRQMEEGKPITGRTILSTATVAINPYNSTDVARNPQYTEQTTPAEEQGIENPQDAKQPEPQTAKQLDPNIGTTSPSMPAPTTGNPVKNPVGKPPVTPEAAKKAPAEDPTKKLNG